MKFYIPVILSMFTYNALSLNCFPRKGRKLTTCLMMLP